MEILQCPECELRFRYPAELDQHLKLEHPTFHVEPKVAVEDSIVSAAHRQRRRHLPHAPKSNE